MDKEIYEKIKDRKARDVFHDLEIQLLMISPDGAKAHKLANLRQYFNSTVSLYDDGCFPPEETIAQLRERDNSDLESSIHKISEVMDYFKVKI